MGNVPNAYGSTDPYISALLRPPTNTTSIQPAKTRTPSSYCVVDGIAQDTLDTLDTLDTVVSKHEEITPFMGHLLEQREEAREFLRTYLEYLVSRHMHS